ncbi:MAG: acetylglutamate kinase [Acidimicrobiales bacterium]|nr:MAG: acetylglutamate kinase [Acidimicrobiales bacterium]
MSTTSPAGTSPAGTSPAGTSPADKAGILVEALPYIRRFWGKVVVIKYGGAALSSFQGGTTGVGVGVDRGGGTFAQDVVLMRLVGMYPVVVHGGGPQIGQVMERLGKKPEFVDGLRVTDAETLDIVRMVLVGKVNRDIVGAINVHQPLAVGMSGEDARLITASPHSPALGFVGDVDVVDPTIVRRLLAEDLIPVVASIGADAAGQAYNINADSAAGALAAALGAEKLVYLTDVEGLRRDPADSESLVRSVSVDEVEAMVEDGTVQGGMIPKAISCALAVRGGVGHAHIVDGRAAHALLLEMFTREGVGTMVSP